MRNRTPAPSGRSSPSSHSPAAPVLRTSRHRRRRPRGRAAAAPSGPPQALLWVGNSFFYYNNSMHGHVALLARGDKSVTHRGVSGTISGSGIDWHDVASYLGPIASASTRSSATTRSGQPARAAVRRGDDHGLQPVPDPPAARPVFHEYARKHAETIRAYGARPILFMSWAYKDKPEMTAQLASSTRRPARRTRAGGAGRPRVREVGRTQARPRALRAGPASPQPRGHVPGGGTVYAALLGKSPWATPTPRASADVALHLQQVAWETVKEYEGR